MPWVTLMGICTGFEILIEEFVQLFLFDLGQGIDLGAEVVGIWYKFDGMVPLLPIRQFIKGLLGENVLEFLVWLGHYVFKHMDGAPPEASASCSEMVWVAPISSV